MGWAGGLAAISSLMSIQGRNNALIAQSEANARTATSYITSMNYNLQNLEMSRRDAFESAIQDMEKTRLQGTRQESSVNAAVNEGLMAGGRTADLLKRSAQADTNRAITSIKSNYQKKSNEIDLNKEAALLQGKQAVASVPQVELPSAWSDFLQVGTAVLNAQQAQESINAIQKQAGLSNASNNHMTAFRATQRSNGYYGAELDWEKMFGDVKVNYTFS